MTEPQKPLLLLRLAGTQPEMGAQHGRLVSADAARLFEFYRVLSERTLAGDLTGPAGFFGRTAVRAVATAWQARLARERPRELAARTEAFVEAVAANEDVDPRGAHLAMATMDALQNCVSLSARLRLGPFGAPLLSRAVVAAAPACSTAIAWGDATADGELVFGRNFDFPGIGVWDVAPAFTVCVPAHGQRYGFFAARGADAPVVTVVNEAGLVMAPHTRWHRGVTFGGAMIVDVVHDIARRAETLADAIAIARERPASSSWGIAIGSARERSAIVIELAGRRVDVVTPAPGASYLTCTNRYRSPAMQEGQLAASPTWAIHSDRRQRRLRELIDSRDAPLTPEVLARFMGDRHDCEAPGVKRRLGAMLAQAINVHCAVVSPAHRRALVGVDRAPCCEGAWAELTWTWDGPRGSWPIGATDASGFTAERRDELVAPHDAATRHVQAAARVFEASHDVHRALAELELAIVADPADPSLRLGAAWLALEAGIPERARVHIDSGLARETEPHWRGQLLAAAAMKPGRRPHVNLMMCDAY